jgi:hypothetical protein
VAARAVSWQRLTRVKTLLFLFLAPPSPRRCIRVLVRLVTRARAGGVHRFQVGAARVDAHA